jgi:hypothetical protein
MCVTVPEPVPNKENLLPNKDVAGSVYDDEQPLEPWKPVVIHNIYGEPIYLKQPFYHMIHKHWRQSLFHRQGRKMAPYHF